MSGGGLEFGVLQPAVSTCFKFYKFASESWLLLDIFIVKGTLIVDMHLLYSLNRKILSYILGRVAIIRVSRALKQTIFVVTCTYCLS